MNLYRAMTRYNPRTQTWTPCGWYDARPGDRIRITDPDGSPVYYMGETDIEVTEAADPDDPHGMIGVEECEIQWRKPAMKIEETP